MKYFAPFLATALLAQQLPEQVTVERVAGGLRYAEGPVWSMEDYLMYSDQVTDRQYKFVPGKNPAELGSRAGGASGSTYDQKENLYSAEFRARRITRTDKKGKVDVIAERFEGKRLNAPNDIVVRRDGNVYFSDPAFGNQEDTRELDFNGVFRVSPKGEIEAIARWQTRPNGIALSRDGRTLYVTDADRQELHAFDLDRDGKTSNDRVLIAKIAGVPGGVKLDEAGNFYIAAENVFVYSPAGQLLRTFVLQETPSNLAWGDADFRTLYVTARTSVYRIRVGLEGVVPYFR